MWSGKVIYRVGMILALVVLAASCSPAGSPAPAGGTPAGSQATSTVAAGTTASSTLTAPVTGGNGTAAAATAQPGAPGAASTLSERTITVVGAGKASGTPDLANVSLGVETQAASVQQAVDTNRTKMTAVLDTLKGLGLADKDIRTTNYGIFTQNPPASSPTTGGAIPGPVTYHVNNQVSVTVRDVTKLGNILDRAVAAGANNIYGINFSVSDTTRLQADARANAMADARARAENLAQLAGVTLGEVLSVSEVIASPGPLYGGAPAGVGGGGAAPIQPGQLDVNLTLQVTYSIR